MTTALTSEQKKRLQQIKRELLQKVDKYTEQYHKKMRTIIKRIDERKIEALRSSLH